jgi:hypothetical protein
MRTDTFLVILIEIFILKTTMYHKYTYTFIREIQKIVVYLTSSCVIWAFFGMSGPV